MVVYAIPFLHQMCHTVDIPGGDIGGFPGRTIEIGNFFVASK